MVTKNTILDICRWNHLERDGTSNGLIQINTRQYCVYYIISLQNATLQIPLVTKSFILDDDKVFHIELCFTHTLNKKAQQLSMKVRIVVN